MSNYATGKSGNISDNKYMQNVGYMELNSCVIDYFSPQNVNMISKKVTQLLQGVHPQGKMIVVPDEHITSIMSSIYDNYQPQNAGDIYTRYIIPSNMRTDAVQDMINQTIEVIVSQIRIDYETREQNAKLTAWTTVLGDFNAHGLRSHAPIKIRLRHPEYMQFNLRY